MVDTFFSFYSIYSYNSCRPWHASPSNSVRIDPKLIVFDFQRDVSGNPASEPYLSNVEVKERLQENHLVARRKNRLERQIQGLGGPHRDSHLRDTGLHVDCSNSRGHREFTASADKLYFLILSRRRPTSENPMLLEASSSSESHFMVWKAKNNPVMHRWRAHNLERRRMARIKFD